MPVAPIWMAYRSMSGRSDYAESRAGEVRRNSKAYWALTPCRSYPLLSFSAPASVISAQQRQGIEDALRNRYESRLQSVAADKYSMVHRSVTSMLSLSVRDGDIRDRWTEVQVTCIERTLEKVVL